MNKSNSLISKHLSLVSWLVTLSIFSAVLIASFVLRPDTQLLYSQQKDTLVTSMGHDLHSALAAEKNAVIAARADKSRSFAAESRQAMLRLENSRRIYAGIPAAEKSQQELAAFDAFSGCWSELRPLQDQLLTLATLNSNVLAQELSAGEAAQALLRMEQALQGLSAEQALIPALKIQALHLPHIVTPEDRVMDSLEARTRSYDQAVRKQLATLSGPPARLQQARQAYADFSKSTARIFDLSRQNTNVHAAELTLGKNQLAAGQCQQQLAQLEQLVKAQAFKATR